MNKARRFELFSTQLDVALFGVQLCAWMCLTRWVQPSSDLVIWTSSQMTFGQDKWTGWTEGSVDKERQGVRDKETELRRLLSDCGIGACHLLLSCLLPM